MCGSFCRNYGVCFLPFRKHLAAEVKNSNTDLSTCFIRRLKHTAVIEDGVTKFVKCVFY